MPNASQQQRQWFKVVTMKAKADEPKRGTVHIYDEIGMSLFGGVDAGELVNEIEAMDVDELEVRINSPGGYAFDGINIAHAILRHKAHVTTYNDGLAASAASIVLLAGDEVVGSKYGQTMLHNSHAAVLGGSDDLREAAKVLDKLDESVATYYADRAGGEAKAWARVMSRETWYNAEEALAAGIYTRIDDSAKREDTENAAAKALASASHLNFKFAGRQAAPAPLARVTTEEEAPVPISDKVAKRLGLATDASDDDVLAKLDELAKTDDKPEGDKPDEGDKPETPAQPETPGAPAGTPPASQPDSGEVSQLTAAAAKLGLVVTLPDELAQLKAGAAAGARAEEARLSAERESYVDKAVDAGKILPVNKAKVLALMALDDKGTRAAIDALPAEAALPITELGHSTESVGPELSADPIFSEWVDSLKASHR
jgi:ATP-dependent protease ClpP protease subunit